MKKSRILCIFLFMCIFPIRIHAQNKVSPKTFIATYSGGSISTANVKGQKTAGWGITGPGFNWTPSFHIKEKVYLGLYTGLETGIGFNGVEQNLQFKLPLGFSGAYAFNENSFAGFKYFLSTNASTMLSTSKDDGWVYGITIKFKNLMVDAFKNQPGNTTGGFLKGRMDYSYWELYPKYIFSSTKKKNFWLGCRLEEFLDSGEPATEQNTVLNVQLSLGRTF